MFLILRNGPVIKANVKIKKKCLFVSLQYLAECENNKIELNGIYKRPLFQIR